MAGKTIPFRLYAQILIFSGLVALGAMILVPIQRAIQMGMIGVRDDLLTRLERQIGRKIRYSSISPSFFGSFDVRNVRIMGEDEHPVLTMSRFSVAYSFLDLLRGKVRAIHTIRIDAPFVDINTTRDDDLIKMLKNLNNGGGTSQQNIAALFPEKLMVRIRNGKCVIFDGKDQFGIDALNLNVEIVDHRMILDGRWDIGITIDTLIDDPIHLFAITRISGSCRTDMEEGEAVLSISAITGDALSSSPIAFGFALENNVLRVGKMPDNLPFEFSLAYWLNDGRIAAQFDCAGLRLHELFSFSGGLEGARQFLDIATSGEVYFERGDSGNLSYTVNLIGTAQDNGYQRFRNMMASFEIDIEGDEQYVRFNTMHLSVPETPGNTNALFVGDVSFTGGIGLNPISPDGILSLSNFSRSGKDGLNADFAINTRDGVSGREIAVSCDALSWKQGGVGAFNALLQPARNNLGFTVSAIGLTETETTRAGSLSLKGNIHSSSRRVDAFLRLDAFSTSDIAGMTLPFTKSASVPIPIKALLDGTLITSEINFATDLKHVAYNAPRFAVTNKTGGGFLFFASLSGTENYFELNGSRLSWRDDTLLFSGKAEFANPDDLQFSVNIVYRDLDYYVEGEVLDGNSVNIQGSYGLDVSLKASGNSYIGSMRAEGFPVPFLGHPAFCSFMARLRYDTTSSWSMNLDRFEMGNIIGPVSLVQIRVAGSANQNGADFPMLYYRDAVGQLNGRADVSWDADFSAINGTVVMGDGAESYNLSGSFDNDRFYLAFTGSALKLDRALRGVKALANGDMRVSWDSTTSLRAECNLYSVTGKLYNQDLGATAAAVLENRNLSVRGAFSFADIQGEIPSFTINGEEGKAEARMVIQGLVVDKPIDSNFLLTAGFKPLRSIRDTKEILNDISGKVHFDKYLYGIGGQTQVFDINFSRSDGIIVVTGGPRNMIRFRMDQDGGFYGGLSSPFPIRGTVSGTINQQTINAACGDLYVDLGELFRLMPKTPEFYLTGGYVNASLEIKGSLTDPEFFGSARATSARIRIPDYIREELRPIPFSIIIDGNEMSFGPVAVAVGKGAGTASGLFFFDRWIPNTFSIDIDVPRETAIPYGFDVGGFVARGDAAGKLNVSMENVSFDISGELYVNNTEMGISYNEVIGPGSTDPFATVRYPFVVDLIVSTGPVVEFFYPSTRFPILRATPDMGTRLRVTADSLAEQYTLVSDVKIRSGEIFYFERSFYIRSGLLMFRENELRFDPRLTARAEIRDRTDDGPVTISMIVDNAPLLSFTARFESTPVLSQMEILALLGQNIAGNQFGEDTDAALRAAVSSISDFGAQFYMVRRLERLVRNVTKLDMFSFRTQVLQNAFLMSTGIMQTPVDRNPGLGNYFDNTTVFGGKYIGQDLFIQGMLSMRYEGERGVTFAPDIGFELRNPLFSIRWDFIPEHPENWYISDNSITLTKSFTF